MAAKVSIGLALTGHDGSTLCTATFDNVTAPLGPAAPTHVEVEFSSSPTLTALVLWDNNATTDTAYEVDRSSDGGNTWTTLTNRSPPKQHELCRHDRFQRHGLRVPRDGAEGTVSSASDYHALGNGLGLAVALCPRRHWRCRHGGIDRFRELQLLHRHLYARGAGADIWNTADGFQFAYTTMTGNGTYVAEVRR